MLCISECAPDSIFLEQKRTYLYACNRLFTYLPVSLIRSSNYFTNNYYINRECALVSTFLNFLDKYRSIWETIAFFFSSQQSIYLKAALLHFRKHHCWNCVSVRYRSVKNIIYYLINPTLGPVIRLDQKCLLQFSCVCVIGVTNVKCHVSCQVRYDGLIIIIIRKVSFCCCKHASPLATVRFELLDRRDSHDVIYFLFHYNKYNLWSWFNLQVVLIRYAFYYGINM